MYMQRAAETELLTRYPYGGKLFQFSLRDPFLLHRLLSINCTTFIEVTGKIAICLISGDVIIFFFRTFDLLSSDNSQQIINIVLFNLPVPSSLVLNFMGNVTHY